MDDFERAYRDASKPPPPPMPPPPDRYRYDPTPKPVHWERYVLAAVACCAVLIVFVGVVTSVKPKREVPRAPIKPNPVLLEGPEAGRKRVDQVIKDAEAKYGNLDRLPSAAERQRQANNLEWRRLCRKFRQEVAHKRVADLTVLDLQFSELCEAMGR